MCWGPGPCSASYGAGLGQPGGERLWAPQVQQLYRAEQRLTPNEKTQAATAEAEGFPDRAGMGPGMLGVGGAGPGLVLP